MDKMTFASYKFKPSDVIEGLNRYFAEAKAFRYRKVSLEIRNGEVKPRNYYVFRNIVFVTDVPKVKECGYYYLICDPEEVVGVAINWLREEHDIFYTPGMEVPVEDFDVFEAGKKYEEVTRNDIFCEENLDTVPVAKVREILGINREVDFFEALKYARGDMDATFRLRAESSELRHRNHELVQRLVDIRKAAGMQDGDPMDLVKFITLLRKDKELNDDEKFQRRKLGQQLRRIREAAGMDDRDLTSIEDYVKGLRKAEKYKRLYEELKSDIKFLSDDIQSALEWSDSEEMKEEK